jgi:hypothetical protein
MKRSLRWLHEKVPIRYIAWINAFLALGLGWGLTIAFLQPLRWDGLVDPIAVLRMGLLTAVGSVVTVTGLLLTRALSQRTQHKGLWIELVGTILLAAGPLQYLAIQIGFLIEASTVEAANIPGIFIAYALLSFMVVRFAIIIPALRTASRLANKNQRRVS